VEEHTTSSGTPISEYIVSFVKANTVFQEVEATSSRDLTAADAISVANRQFANAPNVPASGTNWILLPGVPLVVILLCTAIFAIRRKHRHPAALSGFPSHRDANWGSIVVPPSGVEGFEGLLDATETESIGTEWTTTVPVEVGALIPGASNLG
jgi:hypothetical protein